MAKKTTTKKVTKKVTKKKGTTKPKKKKVIKKVADDDDDDDFMSEDEEEEDIEEDLDEIDDGMLADDVDGEGKRTQSEVELMMREVECGTCDGSSTRDDCKVRDDFGCPSDKEDK
jgi:hypothetical protein